MHGLTHFFFAVLEGHTLHSKKPLLSSHTRGFPAGASGFGLGVPAHSHPLEWILPSAPPPPHPRQGAELRSSAVGAHRPAGPGRRRRGWSRQGRAPGAGAGAGVGAQLAAFASPPAPCARRSRVQTWRPRKFPETLPLGRRDRKCCCSSWDAMLH